MMESYPCLKHLNRSYTKLQFNNTKSKRMFLTTESNLFKEIYTYSPLSVPIRFYISSIISDQIIIEVISLS